MSSNHKQNVQNALNSDRATSNNTSLPEWVQKAKMLEDSKDGTSYNDGFVHQKSTEGKVYMVTKELGAYIDYDIDIRHKNNTYRGWSYKLKKKLQPGDFILITHQIRSVYYQGKHYEVLGGKYKEGNNWSGLYVFWTIYQGVNKIKEVPVDKSKPLNVFVLVEGTKDPLNFGSVKFELDNSNYVDDKSEDQDTSVEDILDEITKKKNIARNLRDNYNYPSCEAFNILTDIVFLDGIYQLAQINDQYRRFIPITKEAYQLLGVVRNSTRVNGGVFLTFFDAGKESTVTVPKDQVHTLFKKRYFSRCLYSYLKRSINEDHCVLNNRFFWEGDNNIEQRKQAGRALILGDTYNKGLINTYDFDRPINFHLIGHSHGGNVIISALHMIDELNNWPKKWKIKSTTFLSTPFQEAHDKKIIIQKKAFKSSDFNAVTVNNKLDLTQQFLAAFNLDVLNPDFSGFSKILNRLTNLDLTDSNIMLGIAVEFKNLANEINSFYRKTDLPFIRIVALAMAACAKNSYQLYKNSFSLTRLLYSLEPIISLFLNIFSGKFSKYSFFSIEDGNDLTSYHKVLVTYTGSEINDTNPIAYPPLGLDKLLSKIVEDILEKCQFYPTSTTIEGVKNYDITKLDWMYVAYGRNAEAQLNKRVEFVSILRKLNSQIKSMLDNDQKDQVPDLLSQHLGSILLGSIPLNKITKVKSILKSVKVLLDDQSGNNAQSVSNNQLIDSTIQTIDRLISLAKASNNNFRYTLKSKNNEAKIEKGLIAEMFTESHSLSHVKAGHRQYPDLTKHWNLTYTSN